jgi:hypothetical protein
VICPLIKSSTPKRAQSWGSDRELAAQREGRCAVIEDVEEALNQAVFGPQLERIRERLKHADYTASVTLKLEPNPEGMRALTEHIQKLSAARDGRVRARALELRAQGYVLAQAAYVTDQENIVIRIDFVERDLTVHDDRYRVIESWSGAL